jgi:hypothetical protein
MAASTGTRGADATLPGQQEEQAADAHRSLLQTTSKTRATAAQQAASINAAVTTQQAAKRSSTTTLPLQQAASKAAAAPIQQAVQKSPVSPQQVMPPTSDVLICDGIERTIVVPIQVNPYTLPTGMSCSRANGGVCAALNTVVCLPYTDINGLIGPVTYGDTQANSAPLLVYPDNPLVFTMERGYYMTYVAWTVYDVGTGGARMVAKYPAGSSIGPDLLAHNWTAAPGTVDGAGNCDACSDCNLGKGIKDMRLKARPGTGYSSFELSQLFGSPRCGKSCFDLDGSYWTGMAYSCVKVGMIRIAVWQCKRMQCCWHNKKLRVLLATLTTAPVTVSGGAVLYCSRPARQPCTRSEP